MTTIISTFIDIISKLHTKIMGVNDGFTYVLSDKMLHFLVIGFFGFLMLLVIQPLFKWFSTHDGTLFITFIYVFTVILVISFAIEIGQAYSGTGDMDFYDIASGIAGFFVFFAIYLFGYLFDKRYNVISRIDKKIEKTIGDKKDGN